MRLDADRQIAHHILIEALLALDLRHGGGRRIDVQQREMRLAILLNAIGERLHPPVPTLFQDHRDAATDARGGGSGPD